VKSYWVISCVNVELVQVSRSQSSSVDIMMDDGLDGWSLIPSKGKFLLVSTGSIPGLGPTQPPMQRLPGPISPAVKRPEREAHHSPPPSAEVKNGGAIPPLISMSSWCSAWLIKNRDSFTLLYKYQVLQRMFTSPSRVWRDFLIQGSLHQPPVATVADDLSQYWCGWLPEKTALFVWSYLCIHCNLMPCFLFV
jgi:hypothetical protein